MKEVTVVSDDDAPLARKRKSSTSDPADGGKKKKTEGGASKKEYSHPGGGKEESHRDVCQSAPPSVSFLSSDIVLFICLIPVLTHFARFRKKATTSLKKSSKTLGASRNIKDMLHRDSSPTIAPATPAVKPSSALTSSQVQEAPGPSVMEVDFGASTELAVVGEQATQERTALQMAEAPAKDAISSGKAAMGAGTSAEGGTSIPQKPIEFPKIVYPVLLPGNTTMVPGGVPSSPTCGIEELLRQAAILRGNNVSFGKLLDESATNLKIIALVSFTLPFAFYMSIPL